MTTLRDVLDTDRPRRMDHLRAGSPVRTSGQKDELLIFLDPGGRRAGRRGGVRTRPRAGVDPPFDGLQDSQLRSPMPSVNDSLSAEDDGDRLAAESPANVLVVNLMRNASALRPPARRTDGALPRTKLHAVVEYIEEYLDTDLTLAQMAAAVHLSVYHFARQFKAATGMPPHRYVVTRRVERARLLLRKSDLSLADIATSAGFSDQSKLSTHFKRVLGVTPRQFRISASGGMSSGHGDSCVLVTVRGRRPTAGEAGRGRRASSCSRPIIRNTSPV